ncbi:hypothetical protein [Bradyrhizobium quebecense]|jgi:hypothetical protein|uniref:Uncharacterized protein n=2 Tax=Bradyrhizobium quebecense TaxID=2748629 RepID=A0ACD3V017_9BRAD|nr:hypothetical protein [Bradyrhizobium quebecense]UGX99717.1 hypothetical protein J4P68_0020500 [Bradyrhizobium quebecense]
MDKPMRCRCGRTRTIVLDKHFRTALVCPKCDEIELAGPAKPEERVLTAR